VRLVVGTRTRQVGGTQGRSPVFPLSGGRSWFPGERRAGSRSPRATWNFGRAC